MSRRNYAFAIELGALVPLNLNENFIMGNRCYSDIHIKLIVWCTTTLNLGSCNILFTRTFFIMTTNYSLLVGHPDTAVASDDEGKMLCLQCGLNPRYYDAEQNFYASFCSYECDELDRVSHNCLVNEMVMTKDPFDIYAMLKQLCVGDKLYVGVDAVHINIRIVKNSVDDYMRVKYSVSAEYDLGGSVCLGEWIFKHEHSTEASSVVAVDKYHDDYIWTPDEIQERFITNPNAEDYFYECTVNSPLIKACRSPSE